MWSEISLRYVQGAVKAKREICLEGVAGTHDLILEEFISFPRSGHSWQRNQLVQRHISVRSVSDFRIVGVWVPCRVAEGEVGRAVYRSC